MNEIISLELYAEVIERTNTHIVCRDLYTSQELELVSPNSELRLASADTFNKIEKVTKTEMARKLLDACCGVFTVTFIKQTGDERVLRGRLVEEESVMGRVLVEDLDLGSSFTNYRQVDLRTIKSLIIGGTKYVLK